MNESLLQFIWYHQYFNLWDLSTVDGDALSIIDAGIWNRNQGPDFLTGKIRINGEEWVGNIELHVKTSAWDLHGHSSDLNYKNVILHVVWEHDRNAGPDIPVLELRPRVPHHLLQRYRNWMLHRSLIPCSGELGKMKPAVVYPWLEWLWLQRVKDKSNWMMELVKKHGMDWAESFWVSIARAFGHKVNADAFEAVASTLPIKLMMRHRHDPSQLEALLFGQAGLLRADKEDEYATLLCREYGFLRKKYQLRKCYQPVHFLRMRPGNFPTIRLAQLATLLSSNGDLFSRIIKMTTAEELAAFFRVQAGEYWNNHYRFGEPSVHFAKQAGEHFIENIIFNTVIPFLAVYHDHVGNGHLIPALIGITQTLKQERDSVTACFEKFGLKSRHAADSQALHELKKSYCDKLNCLNCIIGQTLLRNSLSTVDFLV
jgi:hypothetical protein